MRIRLPSGPAKAPGPGVDHLHTEVIVGQRDAGEAAAGGSVEANADALVG